MKPNPPFDRAVFRDRLQARTGLRFGWPTAADYAHYTHVVTLPGLCRAKLGDWRFKRVFAACCAAAARLAPADHLAEAVYENHARTGYRFAFADRLTAIRLKLHFDAAMAGR